MVLRSLERKCLSKLSPGARSDLYNFVALSLLNTCSPFCLLVCVFFESRSRRARRRIAVASLCPRSSSSLLPLPLCRPLAFRCRSLDERALESAPPLSQTRWLSPPPPPPAWLARRHPSSTLLLPLLHDASIGTRSKRCSRDCPATICLRPTACARCGMSQRQHAHHSEVTRIGRLTARIRAGLFGTDEEERAAAAKDLRLLSESIHAPGSVSPLFADRRSCRTAR